MSEPVKLLRLEERWVSKKSVGQILGEKTDSSSGSPFQMFSFFRTFSVFLKDLKKKTFFRITILPKHLEKCLARQE